MAGWVLEMYSFKNMPFFLGSHVRGAEGGSLNLVFYGSFFFCFKMDRFMLNEAFCCSKR